MNGSILLIITRLARTAFTVRSLKYRRSPSRTPKRPVAGAGGDACHSLTLCQSRQRGFDTDSLVAFVEATSTLPCRSFRHRNSLGDLAPTAGETSVCCRSKAAVRREVGRICRRRLGLCYIHDRGLDLRYSWSRRTPATRTVTTQPRRQRARIGPFVLISYDLSATFAKFCCGPSFRHVSVFASCPRSIQRW